MDVSCLARIRVDLRHLRIITPACKTQIHQRRQRQLTPPPDHPAGSSPDSPLHARHACRFRRSCRVAAPDALRGSHSRAPAPPGSCARPPLLHQMRRVAVSQRVAVTRFSNPAAVVAAPSQRLTAAVLSHPNPPPPPHMVRGGQPGGNIRLGAGKKNKTTSANSLDGIARCPLSSSAMRNLRFWVARDRAHGAAAGLDFPQTHDRQPAFLRPGVAVARLVEGSLDRGAVVAWRRNRG